MSPDRPSEARWEQHFASGEASVATAVREEEEEEEERVAVPAPAQEEEEKERAAVATTAQEEKEQERAAVAAAAAEAMATVHEESAAFAAAVTATVAVDRPSSAPAPRPPRRRSGGPRSPSGPTPNASAELAPPRALVSASALRTGDAFDSMWESGELEFLLESPRLPALQLPPSLANVAETAAVEEEEEEEERSSAGISEAAPADTTEISHPNAATVGSGAYRVCSSEAPTLPADAVIDVAATKDDSTAVLSAVAPAVAPSQPAAVTASGTAMFGFTALSSLEWEIE